MHQEKAYKNNYIHTYKITINNYEPKKHQSNTSQPVCLFLTILTKVNFFYEVS